MNKTEIIIKVRLVIILAIIVVGFVIWNGLPDKVPVHFSSSGSASYGNKYILLMTFILP